MKDVKHLADLLSERLNDWLLEHIGIKGVGIIFLVVGFLQLINVGVVSHIDYPSIYQKLSITMDVVWWTDVVFSVISAGNWLFRKFWKSL